MWCAIKLRIVKTGGENGSILFFLSMLYFSFSVFRFNFNIVSIEFISYRKGMDARMEIKERMKDFITNTEDLSPYISFTPEEKNTMDGILDKYPMAIPPYYLSLIDFSDPEDPIRKMCIPSISETDVDGTFDTSGEKSNTVMTGMQIKYKQTAMILSTNRCAMYCRHCFRKRLVGLSDEETAKHFDHMVEVIREREDVSSVLISGGDAFLNSNRMIEYYLKVLCEIDHLDFIRFGTRIPVVLPDRINKDPELIKILGKYNRRKQIYVVTQFNHPRELTQTAKDAIELLIEIGVHVKNQTVLLKGVNDNPETLALLLKMLTRVGVAPYYIFQCRPVTGVKNQFQIPLEKGYEIVEAAKNLQNGFGKALKYVLSHETGKIEILGKAENGEMIFKYHQSKDSENRSRIFMRKLEPDQCWPDL